MAFRQSRLLSSGNSNIDGAWQSEQDLRISSLHRESHLFRIIRRASPIDTTASPDRSPHRYGVPYRVG